MIDARILEPFLSLFYQVKPSGDGEDFDSNEPPKKKYKGGPSYRESATDIYSSAENSDTIELDLRDSVLGQHAGELLLDLHREFINKEANYYEEDRKINMLGMIVNGTYVSYKVNKMIQLLFQSTFTMLTASNLFTHLFRVLKIFDDCKLSRLGKISFL